LKKYLKISISSLIFLFVFLPGYNSYTGEIKVTSLFTKNKFFVQTTRELSVSEATGEISVKTGIPTIDARNVKYNITKIKRLFKFNSGDEKLFNELGMSRIYVFYTENNTKDIAEIIKDYNSDENIEYSEPNFIGFAAGEKGSDKYLLPELNKMLPNDSYFYKQWYLKNDGTVRPTTGSSGKSGADVNIIKAWDIEQGNDDLIVAILDSGINDDSPDLSQRLWVNTKEIPNNGIDDDHNGYIDDYKGWDFAYEGSYNQDGFGHGTNIATVIGARTNNNYGFAGINSKCKLMNCKNLNDDNSGEYEWWAKSIIYAVDNGARIINMSEGGADYSKTLKKAVDYALKKGVLVSAAMMNKANNDDYYPASYIGVFAVGATDTDDKRCKRFTWGGGSCWGKHISVVAPGNKIYGIDYSDVNNFDLYWSGTSQATAVVSGLASLLLTQKPERTVDELKSIITSTALDLVGDPSEDKPGWDQFMGYGRVDFYRALTYDRSVIIEDKNQNIEKDYPPENNKVTKRQAKAIIPDSKKGEKVDDNQPAKSR
jgi:thermitase